jgi:hypothetical protein
MSKATVVNLNSLFSSDRLEEIVEHTLSNPYTDVLFRLKTRRKAQPTKIPSNLMDKADCIVSFDLYSLHAEVLKPLQGWTEEVIKAWDSYIVSMNAI